MVDGGPALLQCISFHPDVRHRLAYLVLRSATGLFAMLPLAVAQRLGSAMGVAVAVLLPRRGEMVARHARRLGLTGGEVRPHVRAVFAGYGRYWAEVFWVRPRRRSQIEAETVGVGLEHVQAALDRGRGMILALPHLGNWEFAGPFGDRMGFELVAVAENLTNRHLRDWFTRVRAAMGIAVLVAGGGVMRDLEAVIARNGAVALLCDRDLKGRGVPVRFFGEMTTLPAGPVTLALKTGAPLLPVAAYFEPDGGHRVVVRPPIPLPSGGDRAADLVQGTQLLAGALEELITDAPAQWHLLQPNWPSDRQ